MAQALRKAQAADGQASQFRNEHLIDFFVAQKEDGEAGGPTAGGRPPSAARSEASEHYGDDDFEGEEHEGAAAPSGGQEQAAAVAVAGGGKESLPVRRLSSLDDISLPPASSSSSSQGASGGSSGQQVAVVKQSSRRSSAEEGGAAGSTEEETSSSYRASGTVGQEEGKSARSSHSRQIPLYFRGGEKHEGLGSLLGNALAVLYVARHGLTSFELTRLLMRLRDNSDRKICNMVWKQREILLDMFREMDDRGSGLLHQQDIFGVVQRLDPKLKLAKLERLFKLAGALWGNDNNLVVYEKLIEFCGAQLRVDSSTTHTILAEEVDGRGHVSLACTGALEEGAEDTLLDVLTALGVMYSARDQVRVCGGGGYALRGQ
jgi:hypothetical protein